MAQITENQNNFLYSNHLSRWIVITIDHRTFLVERFKRHPIAKLNKIIQPFYNPSINPHFNTRGSLGQLTAWQTRYPQRMEWSYNLIMRLFPSSQLVFSHLARKTCETPFSGLMILDTYFIKCKTPVSFYRSEQPGCFQRMGRNKLTFKEILDVIKDSTGITTRTYRSQIVEDEDSSCKDYIENIILDYYDSEGLRQLLKNLPNDPQLIIQAFPQPEESSLSLIEVDWQPSFVAISKHSNIHRLNNILVRQADRMHLSSIDTRNTRTLPITAKGFKKQLAEACSWVHRHVAEASNGSLSITRMRLFITRSNHKIILMAITELQFQSSLRRSLPGHVAETRFSHPRTHLKRPLIKDAVSACSMCGTASPKLYGLEMKHAVRGFRSSKSMCCPVEEEKFKRTYRHKLMSICDDQEERDIKLEDAYKSMPRMVMQLWGYLPKSKYRALTKNPVWMDSQASVCMDCYLLQTQYIKQAREKPKKLVKVLKKRKLQKKTSIFSMKNL